MREWKWRLWGGEIISLQATPNFPLQGRIHQHYFLKKKKKKRKKKSHQGKKFPGKELAYRFQFPLFSKHTSTSSLFKCIRKIKSWPAVEVSCSLKDWVKIVDVIMSQSDKSSGRTLIVCTCCWCSQERAFVNPDTQVNILFLVTALVI